MKIRNLFYTFFVLTFSTSLALSQNARLSGIVSDSLSGDELVGANVFITGTSLGAATNDKGSYEIKNISPGTYKLKVSYIGYESNEIELTFDEAKTYDQDFLLKYTTIEGKSILVTAQAKGQMDAIN